MKAYIFLLLLLFPVWLSAQRSQVIEASSGSDLSNKVSTQLQYLFPEFTAGEVYYQKTPKGSGMMNYNMLTSEMQFMDDVQVMALDTKDVVMVNINDRKFFPVKSKEFAEELLSKNKYQLRVKRKVNNDQHSKIDEYVTTTSTSSITSYSSYSHQGGMQYELLVSSNVLVSLKNFYYLVGANGKYTQIKNAKTFTKQFPAYSTQIETFVKEQNIRFDKEDDLMALLVYCGDLSK